jgi:WD40-like Beta Propeller Repeat
VKRSQLSLLAMVPFLACSTEPRPNAQGTSILAITVATVGHSRDANGYQARLDGVAAGQLAVQDTLFVGPLDPGEHAVELADVATNCEAIPGAPQIVQLEPGSTVYTSFAVGCDSVLAGVILFTRLTPASPAQPGGSGIFHIRPDGSGLGRVASGSRATSSPDGRQIVFQRDGLPGGIWRINVDGTHPVDLTPTTSADQCPAWSPDGSLIAFSSNRSGEWELYVMKPDGRDQRRLTFSDGHEQCGASWSPDGLRLVFGRSLPDHSSSEIFVINADGTGELKLSKDANDGDSFPVWSPDGGRILFNSTRSSTNQLWMMQANGELPQNLTNADEFHHGLAAWSPQGTEIVFERVTGIDLPDLFKMRADGTGIVALTEGSSWDSPSQWLP